MILFTQFCYSANQCKLGKRHQTIKLLLSITILGYSKLLQNTYDTFYPILSTFRTTQTRIFSFFSLFFLTTMYPKKRKTKVVGLEKAKNALNATIAAPKLFPTYQSHFSLDTIKNSGILAKTCHLPLCP